MASPSHSPSPRLPPRTHPVAPHAARPFVYLGSQVSYQRPQVARGQITIFGQPRHDATGNFVTGQWSPPVDLSGAWS